MIHWMTLRCGGWWGGGQGEKKSFKMTAVVICTIISAAQASGRISILATQSLRYLIDLMKNVR